ncbi:MAG TPA: trypsin-like peptidase domain-containing protein [Gammaproteobacteria bacterium]|nr:trypsin-like peptidase domain-containing protein [Gammaproteobacteria bacterium]
MKALTRLLFFLFQAAVVGLAAAFVVVWLKPGLLVTRGLGSDSGQASYAPAVALSSPAVVNVHSARRVRQTAVTGSKTPSARGIPGQYAIPPVAQLESSLGSGVIVSSDGYILTNYHVINGAEAIQAGLQDGRVAAARVVGVDPDTDLALLKVDMSGLKPIEFGRSDDLRVGDVVLAIGDPYGVGQTVTQGIVSATGRNQLGLSTFENFIQTDAAINPGNSGGALVNARGELVGINTALFSPSGGSNGIGFAIPVNLARGVMQQLIDYGRVLRGWLGVEPQDITPELAQAFRLQDTRGFLITRVTPLSPASVVGLAPGDVIKSIDGDAVENSRDALNRIAAKPPGTAIQLAGVRNGKNFNVKVTVAERPVQQSNS